MSMMPLIFRVDRFHQSNVCSNISGMEYVRGVREYVQVGKGYVQRVCPKEYVEVKFQGYVQVDKVMQRVCHRNM